MIKQKKTIAKTRQPPTTKTISENIPLPKTKPQKTEKEKLVEKEIKKLKSIFKGVDKETMSFILPLIENVAYMKATLQELQKDISENGAIEFYQNGANQKGQKPSSAATVYNSMIKNYLNCITKLEAYMPSMEEDDDSLREFE